MYWAFSVKYKREEKHIKHNRLISAIYILGVKIMPAAEIRIAKNRA